ncbi:DNA primase [Novacetimonas hansenii]|uniref:DNA primase n=2 Tax=Novacetimonas hansenii TaxID=436 RepID=A0ABQ0SBR0_NOVHA|nr:DNA primase [Novacetimonas hansenii]EFG83648.1 DNA primase [Novacetimonas hansenii ATCC 23769]MBL7238359.1 DNA primase [Novacetimonas hansenii]QOF96038.1 DNA primase [Novacetimonas hansenii]GAN84282.1 DNA primase [Novacetimonas hansenii JCM 7643]GBQ62356.1 DNA primase [Novacetimonas hansenii NRIC 0243]
MAFDPAFLDELRARTPITSVIGRRTKLVRSGRNWKACCPFHGEKTPSFYVYDDHFHCFGCGVHGDVISFVMQSEGRSFPEAVEELATAAGLEMPRMDRTQREAQREARTLGDVLEAVQQAWRLRLHRNEGREGLAYLRGRGLTDETIAAFGLGWSGDGRGGLVAELAAQDITAPLLAQAGLMRVDEHGQPKGELFFNRVTFPIHDRRGRLVSFGGRILGDGQPKYLNGPETAIFSKRRVLFGLDRARAAVRAPRGGGHAAPAPELLVVEGYMDVIALHQAGFTGAVAPLGTALTPEQMEALWQVSSAPVLCFDGDAAGQRAAVKAAETALPLLNVERTLRFCTLPEGEDPDSLLRQRGTAAMAALVEGARPLSEVLFGLLSEGTRDPGPEQRAALRQRLVEAAGLIPDKSLASEYRSTLLDRFFATFRRRPAMSGRGGRGQGAAPAARSLAGVLPVAPDLDAQSVAMERMRILTAILLRHPEVLEEVQDAYCRLDMPPELSALRAVMLDMLADGDGNADASALLEALGARIGEANLSDMRERVLSSHPLPLSAQERDDLMVMDIRQEWWHFYALLNVERFAADIRLDTERMSTGPIDERQWESLRVRLLTLESLRRGGDIPDTQ